MVLVTARQCPYDPSPLIGVPLGQFHCDACGCMVVAGLEHGPCFPSFCPSFEEGWHPGPEVQVEVDAADLLWLGLGRDGKPLFGSGNLEQGADVAADQEDGGHTSQDGGQT